LVFWLGLFALGRVGDVARVPLEALGGLLGSVVLGMAIGDSLYLRAMHAIGVSRALPIATTYPILTAILSLVILREPVTVATFAGILLVVVGVYLVAFRTASRADGSKAAPLALGGVVAALGASLCWSFAPVILKPSLDLVDPLVANTIRLPTACMVLVLMSVLSRRGGSLGHPFAFGRRTAGLLALAGLCNGLSSGLWIAGLHEAGAAKAAALSSTAPIFAAPLAALVLRERLNANVLVGTGLTVVGVALVL
jgi:drug/metabolite transporter (DMT)-like permease